MGAGATKHLAELEEAQHHVRRLTAEKLNLAQVLSVKASALGAVEAEVHTLRQKTSRLTAVESELSTTATELLKAKRVPLAAAEMQDRALNAESALQRTREELQLKKEELQAIFGKLKFEAQEERALAQKSAKAETAAQLATQRDVERESAILVAQANAALVAEAGADAIEHPVFGTLLADLGHKRLYRADPRTLWAGTLLWDQQRVFRRERAELIAASKSKSAVEGWPGAISVVEIAETSSDEAPADARADHSAAAMRLGAVVDGQHRLGAAQALAEKGKLEPPLQQMMVEVCYPQKKTFSTRLFLNVAPPLLPDVQTLIQQN